ncbi:MAG: VPS10 domain-containing protein [Candidatus Omnitrophota bacterium]
MISLISFKRNSILKPILIGILFLWVTALYPVTPNGNESSRYSELLKPFKLRNIGPANMGGRTVDFAAVEHSSIVYAAIGPSGLWKSTDNGIHWSPVFDNQTSASIGAVSVSRSHPDIVWVGTGEATSRNSVAIGDGVYKSEDAGKTWKHMGLTETRHIDRILIDPTNPDIVYVGAMGHLWGPNKERGVFKTTDGGKTWKNILYFDENTGISEMVMDPSNSRILYAGAYSHRRKPFHFTSGGPNSGLYKSTDGGETWKQLKTGLPEGVNGRIGIAVCQSKPNVVYTIIENKEGGIFRSVDKGETWTRTCDKKTYDKVNFRPFYYSKITADPNNELVLYAYSGKAFVSEDGGKTFNEFGKEVHPDHHRIWVDPADSNHLIDGNDGGIDISWDRGKTWYPVENAILAEIYQLTYDMRDPYYVYIGLQDNGSWAGPVNSQDKRGILNHHWYPIGTGDGFYAQVDPRDHNYVYRNWQMGGIELFDQRNGQNRVIRPNAPASEAPYRFNWNAPVYLSPTNPDNLYIGGNFLFRSTDRGNSWVKISPDLSTNDPQKIIDSGGPISVDNTGAEVHCTIYTICESPVKKGTIWTGTDDGNVWGTRNDGQNWENVTKNIKGLPPFSWVSRIEASHFAEGTVYATFDRHLMDDYTPYVYKSTDFGKTWTSLQSNLPKTGYLHVVREDPVNPDLLYLGSEFGLFFSFNGGREWIPFKNEFPTTAVRDIAIHPRDHDLIVGTHGRGVWVLDDLTPLQQLNASILKKEAHLFDIRPGLIYYQRKSSDLHAGAFFAVPNPPFGAAIHYYLDAATASDPNSPKVQLHVYDMDGTLVRTFDGTRQQGINRVYWDLRGKPVFNKLPDELKDDDSIRWLGLPSGPFVLPGTYKVVLECGKTRLEKTVEVRKDKNLEFPIDEWKENQVMLNRVNESMYQNYKVTFGIKEINRQLKEVEAEGAKMKDMPQALSVKLADVRKTLDQLIAFFIPGGSESGSYRRPLQMALRGGGISEQLHTIQSALNNYPGKPTEAIKAQFNEMIEKMNPLVGQYKELLEKGIPELNQILRQNNFNYIKVSESKED